MNELDEYLRRNLILAKAYGALAGIEYTRNRCRNWTNINRRAWLEDSLTKEMSRLQEVITELINLRNEAEPCTPSESTPD